MIKTQGNLKKERKSKTKEGLFYLYVYLYLQHKAHLEERYTNGLQRSLVLIDSGLAGGDFVVMGNSVDELLFYLEQRMSILQSLMKQQLGANSVLNN